jgi:PKD repeat protein
MRKMKSLYIVLLTGFAVIYFNGCKKDDFPVPPASTVPLFTYTVDNNSFAPATVTFTNTSIVPGDVGTVNYYWNFGDSTSSEETNPVHYYDNPGAYTVSLVAVTSVSLEVKKTTNLIIIKDPNASGTPIYFTNGTQVFRALLNNLAPIFELLPINGLQDSYGMTIDTVNDKLYISDFDAGQILQSDLDGSNQVIFRSGLDGPDALAIDYQMNHIYWDVTNGIQRANMSDNNVSQKENFVIGQANDPDGICIDPVSRTLFWVNYNGGVWKKNLDGSGEALIIPTTGGGGSIIVADDKIYYDDYAGPGDIRLQSANFDGTGVALIAAGISRVVYGLSYDSSEQKIYWGDRTPGTIMRANLDGSSAQAWYVSAGSSPRGITFGKPM